MRPLAIVTNPPMHISDEVQTIGYKHMADGVDYIHQFRPGVEMHALRDGTLEITHAGDRNLHRDFGGQRFLVNPPGGKKMARRLPPRHKSGPNKGRFMKRRRAAPQRRAPQRRRQVASRSRAPARRRRPTQSRARVYSRPRARRRNPCENPQRMTFRNITRQLTDGAMDSVLVLTGKAATRTIPLMANLPKEGNIGLAIQALTAVVVGMIAQRVVTPARARMILAGGLTAPLETLIVSYNVPFLAPALQPVESDAQLSAYHMGGYVSPAAANGVNNGVGGYAEPGLGQYYGEPAFA